MSGGGLYNFKQIVPVPTHAALIDIVLSKTQRKTPTVTHPGYEISRIRSFYTRKVKFCMQTFHDKLSDILSQFPRLDDIHPFYADLCNVLYDRDHYKIALGQVNAVRNVIDHVSKDYVRLLKYADSPYKCKMLKRAALGRMCTATKKLSDSLKYLEEIRMHLARLPSINPNTRTLILTGYPNVGKSSFMNKVSNADVDVQPYAFTTKSLFVGHFDYQYSPWQVIDTPGILDHPLEQRNTIEMTAITALAHLQSAVLYFLDPSENCGWSIKEQVKLFHSIKPLFRNKPVVVVLNKTDLVDPDTLPEDDKRLIEEMALNEDGSRAAVEYVKISCMTSTAIDEAKNKACELLLTQRVKAKIETKRADNIQCRLFITNNGVTAAHRPSRIPQSVLEERASGVKSKVVTERDIQEENGGAGVYRQDWNSKYILDNEDWRYDAIPEIMDGKNVADFVDPDIDRKLRELEEEEALLLQMDELRDNGEELDWHATQKVLEDVHDKIKEKRLDRMADHTRNGPNRMARRGMAADEAEKKLQELGYNTNAVSNMRGRSRSVVRKEEDVEQSKKRDRAEKYVDEVMDIDMIGGEDVTSKKKMKIAAKLERSKSRAASPSAHRSRSMNRNEMSLGPDGSRLRVAAQKKADHQNLRFKQDRKQGEADRFIGTKMPKHLFSGKRSNGTANHR